MLPSVFFYLIGGVSVVLSVPLILRRVPVNRAYGIKIAEAYESDERWYAINAFGGKVIAGYGLVLLGLGYYVGSAAAALARGPQALLRLVPVILMLPILGVIKLYARRK